MKWTLHRICASVLILAATCPAPIFGQVVLPVRIDLDHAAFAYAEDESLVELYLAVEATTLDFQREGDAFVARLPLDMALIRSTTTDLDAASSESVWSDSLILRFALPDTNSIGPGQHFVHQVRAVVPPGEYELRLTVAEDDALGRPKVELRREVPVPDFGSRGQPALSDVTLATHITTSDEREDTFYKNGLIIRPNANQLFGQSLDRLYYYAEAYGADAIAGSDGEYTVYAFVAEANRPQAIGDLERRYERAARTPDVLAGDFDVSGLPSGSYFLRLAVLNESNEAVVEQSRKFFVYNPGIERTQPPAVEIDFETSPYASMTEEEVEKGLAHASIIANDMEQRRVKRLPDLDAERRFLMEFWEKRDDQPETPVNEFRDEFYRRIQYANDRYSSNMLEGWKSDRGRVIIKYGLPSQIEPHLYDRSSAPHEIWQYDNIPGEGQALFVFADVTGFGQFELLHSTVAGERSLPNWREELSRR